MKVKINPSRAYGTVTAPPSKSIAHRALICAALAKGASKVIGVSGSEDISATLDCINSLGAKVSVADGVAAVRGVEPHRIMGRPFKCRESGSTLRFMMPIAAVFGGMFAFYGTQRLISRGIGIYEQLFELYGVKIKKEDEKIALSGQLPAGKYVFAGNVSSQFVTGLMIALSLADGDSEIQLLPPVESRAYIDITISVLESFGVKIEQSGENSYTVRGNCKFVPTEYTVEGDWSNAAFLLAYGREVEVLGLNENSIQGDSVFPRLLKQLEEPDPVIDVSDCPDLAPILFAVAAERGGALFVGTHRLKIKESDRADAMAQELAKFGIKAVVEENSVTIPYGELQRPTQTLCGHGDHRIVMALAFLCSLAGGEIDGAEAVSKSYPEFFDTLRTLHVEVENEL